MTEEFNLSDRIAITNFTTISNFIRAKDVKEFVKEIKECFDDIDMPFHTRMLILTRIDEKAGDKLI